MATPAWSQSPSQPVSPSNSPVPQLLETTVAPRATASFSAVPRSEKPLELASTSRMLQRGQAVDTMSRSTEISEAAPCSGVGSGLAWPSWLTLVKHLFLTVQAGRSKVDRKTARSEAALGSS